MEGDATLAGGGCAARRRIAIYTLPVIIIAFVFIAIFAILTELPLWMVGLAAVLALVGNAIVLSVQDRVREHAILQTLGYRSSLIARLIVSEGALLGLLGGVLGTLAAAALLRWKSYSLSTEGLSIEISLGANVLILGLLISGALGVVAGLVPAWRASRQEITQSFRAV